MIDICDCGGPMCPAPQDPLDDDIEETDPDGDTEGTCT